MINALQYDSLRTTSSSINEEISISDNDKNDFEKPSSNMDVICLKCKYKYLPTKRKAKKKKKWFGTMWSFPNIYVLARKVALNSSPYEEREYFDEKVILIFYKRIQVELIVYLLRLYSWFARYTGTEKDSVVTIRRSSLRKVLVILWLDVFYTFFNMDILCGK